MDRDEFDARVLDVLADVHFSTKGEEHLSVDQLTQLRYRFDVLICEALGDALILSVAKVGFDTAT
jgi:hypothetical protein